MRKSWMVSATVTALLISAVLFSGSRLGGGQGARIEFKHESKDFGEVNRGEILKHVFRFKNSGDETLLVRRVRTSCGCTAALVSKDELEPGESGEIKVTFNTRGYAGYNKKFVYVETNDPGAPQKRLVLTASIDFPPAPRIELKNYSADLGLVVEGEALQTEILIENKGELELTVTPSHREAEYTVGGKKVTGAVRIPAKKETRVRVKIPARTNKGLIREYIILSSNDPVRPNLSVYLSGYVVSKAQLKELFAKYKKMIE